MATFFEDPRLRQRWNEISHNAETVTENAAAGIWSFSHNYISPCLASFSHAVEECLTPCLGDPEGRALRAAQRRRRAEYNFDFYDDWEAEEYGYSPEFDPGVGTRSGLLASWAGEDWDRLLAGTGSTKGRRGQEVEQRQPRRLPGMSYGTRGPRRKASGGHDDPTIIPSTAPLGFLSRLPWKISRTLRYKPSAADLHNVRSGRIHPNETAPLLESEDIEDDIFRPSTRKRSGTTGSGETSDSYRSRGDLFPSDGEGEEDAVPLDDDFTMPLDPVSDQSSGKSRTLSKGKRPAIERLSRTVSRTTIASNISKFSLGSRKNSGLGPQTPPTDSAYINMPSNLENDEIERKHPEALVAPSQVTEPQRVLQIHISEPKLVDEERIDSPMVLPSTENRNANTTDGRSHDIQSDFDDNVFIPSPSSSSITSATRTSPIESHES